MNGHHESLSDFLKALGTLLLLCAAGYAMVIAVSGYVEPIVERLP
jgi:hypothetical protein